MPGGRRAGATRLEGGAALSDSQTADNGEPDRKEWGTAAASQGGPEEGRIAVPVEVEPEFERGNVSEFRTASTSYRAEAGMAIYFR